MNNTLRHKAISGLSWSAFSQVMQQGMGLIISLILARLLGPSAYGLIGMVAIFTGFGSMFVELGLASGLVQRKVLEAEHASSVFWVNVLMGSMLTLSMASAAPLIARIYSEPALIPIARVSSLAFVLGALGTVQNALLCKEMRFGALAKIDVISTALSGLLGISMALKGFGVWSLVAQSLSSSFVRTLGLWGASQWRPKLLFTLKALREFAGFSGNLLGFNAFNYWVRNADNLLIGRFIGSQGLGLYSRAYQLMVLPVYQISGVAGAVMFPVLASVQHDLARVRSIYLRSIGSVHLIAAPIYVGLFVIADTFVGAVLGERWRGLVPILRILCTCGFFQPVGNSTGWLYTSLGRTDKMFKWGVLTGVMYVVAFFIGLKWGLLGVTWSYCIVNWAFWYPCWSIPGKLAGLSFTQMLAPLMPTSLCAIAMGIGTWLVGLYLKSVEPTWIVLVMQVLSGTAIYGLLVLGLRVKSGKEVLALIAEQLRFAKA
jgi:O-antigen/teichoic acid export membrane protein